ncbi:MAG: ABC transporter ATP-binding protein [Betaproteobacteria bacterium]|nr:ABC transporter ATP-binding protein [Betaproteobacteria bacterium]MBU6512347.1 ABC transporter ATP-binding protein [Betaproteobacteria bacterium]MDE1954467.1 ABC transporter ATP-binding protein [Betaproteobacteria bacterium]MDE2152586.1 ABC transporter ATP-binding protein [Betaproteobacteria bacterium]MDE2479666.1 ABC transporter ATP-binding protein [Betaproteobacteria bacterium]
MTDSAQYVLEAREVRKRYAGGPQTVEVLAGVSLRLRAGESLAITGASGSGKSTLLHLLGGLDLADAGHIEVRGASWAGMSPAQQGQWRNRNVGFVYQFHHLLPEFSALDNVMMPLRIRRVAAAQAQQRAAALLEQVGLAARLRHRPAELSGGERQRVALARALVTQPALLLADEPTGNLDADSADVVFELIEAMAREHGSAMVLVTHDASLAARCGRTLHLQHGTLHEAATA